MFYDAGIARGFYVTEKTNIHVKQEWQTSGTVFHTYISVYVQKKLPCLLERVIQL